MSIGNAKKNAFKAILRIKGQTIIVYKNGINDLVNQVEVRGIKDSDEGHSEVIFQFPEAVGEIAAGAVLQVKGSKDFWLVKDTEDQIIGDVFVSLDVKVKKINQQGEEVSPHIQSSNTVHIGGNVQGGIQVGTIHSSQTITIKNNAEVDDILAKMIDAIQGSALDKYDQQDAVHNLKQIQALAKEEKTPNIVEKIKNKLETVQAITKSTTELATTLMPYYPAIDAWIRSHFGI